LQRLGDFDVRRKRGRRGVHDDELVIARQGQDVVEPQPRWRRIDELASRHQRRRLRQPGRVPERTDLAPCLITRARPSIEPIEGRRVQKQRPHTHLSPSTGIRPPGPTRNTSSRHKILPPQKLPRKPEKEKTSRNGKSQSPPTGRSRRRAIRPAEIPRSAHDTNTSQHQTALKPDSTAASAVNTIVCVMIDPAKPKGAIAR